MKDLKIGHRVKNINDGRNGFVISSPTNKLVPVAIEGSTRRELWPEMQTKLKPLAQQLVKLGGKFKPPTGFPLYLK